MKKYLYTFDFINPADETITHKSICGDRGGIVEECNNFCSKYNITNNMTEALIRNLFYFDKKRGVYPYKKPPYILSYSRVLYADFFKDQYADRYDTTANASVISRRFLSLYNEYMINYYKGLNAY